MRNEKLCMQVIIIIQIILFIFLSNDDLFFTI